MADLDTIRTVTIKAQTEGTEEAVKSLHDVADAQDSVAKSSDTSAKSFLDQSAAADKHQRSLDPLYRATQLLSKTQQDLGHDLAGSAIDLERYNQLMGFAAQRFKDSTNGVTPFSRALDGVKSQLVGLSAGLGPVGIALAGFGPAGLVAGAALGGVSKALEYFLGLADSLATKAQSLQAFAQVTKLSTDNIQSLQNVASKFGTTTDQVGTFVDRFTIQLTDLRNATGPLFEAVQKINGGIAQQMLGAKETATELQLLAQAYAQAGSDGNKLLQLAGGRGASAAGPLLSALGDAGSIDQLAQSMGVVNSLTDAQIKNLRDLKNESDDLSRRISDNIASFGAENALRHDVEVKRNIEAITAAVKNFSFPDAWMQFTDVIARLANSAIGASDNITNFGKMSPPKIPAFAAPNFSAGPIGDPSPEALANKYKTLVQWLGTAATANEQLKVKTDTLTIAFEKHIITLDTYNRAIAAARTDANLQNEAQRLSLLGELATTTERLTDQTNRMIVARQRGVILSDTEVDAIKRGNEARLQGEKIQQQASLGIATSTDIAAQKQREFQVAVDNGAKSAEQQAAVLSFLDKKYEDLALHSATAAAALPGLKQLEIQAGSLRTQFDQLGTGITNGISGPLLDIASGTTKAADGFRQMASNITRAILQMVINMQVALPIAKALQSVLGGAIPVDAVGNGGIGNGGFNFMDAQAGRVATAHTGGIVGNISATRYVHPAYFENARRYHSGGVVSDEVPIIARRGEGVFTSEQMKAMGGNSQRTSVVVNNYGSDQATQESRQGPNGEEMIIVTIGNAIAQGKLDAPLASRHGLKPTRTARA